MKVREFLSALDARFPLSLAAEWDNSGMQVGNPEDEVKGIYIALDPTSENISQCIQAGCNVLLAHHPLLFKPLSRVTTEDFVGRRVMELVQNGISCISMHTNFDVAAMGPLVADKFGYRSVDSLDDEGIGSIGGLKVPMKLSALAAFAKETFGLSDVRIYGNPGLLVGVLAIVPGSGHGDIDIARKRGADALITGDISHHDGLDALEKGLCVIDAGHYGLEQVFVEYMVGQMRDIAPGVSVSRAASKMPYHTV